jgi:hypothetical protein
VLAGVYSEGLITTVFPAARAGIIFATAIKIGKFQGVINAQTPMGSCQTCAWPASGRGLVGFY